MTSFRFPLPEERTLIMGIINLTPDSFYSASSCGSEEKALLVAEKMIEEGADILDIGAESSRPGSVPLSEEEELKRLLPFIEKLAKTTTVPVSVDTYKPAVAKKVLDVGARIINDITGLQRYSEMAEIISRFGAGVVLMHMQGTPSTMQDEPKYDHLIKEVSDYLKYSVEIAISAGIDSTRIAVDPGIGFGKSHSHNLLLLKNLNQFNSLCKPILLGISRKSFIGNILNAPVEERLEGSLSAAVFGVIQGASIIRTHDVQATCKAIKIVESIMNEKD